MQKVEINISFNPETSFGNIEATLYDGPVVITRNQTITSLEDVKLLMPVIVMELDKCLSPAGE